MSWRHWLLCGVLKAHRDKIGSGKWETSRSQFVGNTSQGILVGFFTNRAPEHLRSHIMWSSPNRGGLFDTCSGEHRRNAKVCQQSLILRCKENIFRFEVAMDNVLVVGML